MASITSAGVGSGLDIESLVTQLVASERQPAADRISRVQTQAQTRLSAFGTFKSAMTNVQTALTALKATGSVGKLMASSANTDLYTASAANGAATGSYDIEVLALAKAGKQASAAVASADTALGAGNVAITVGSASFTVTLSSGNDTLANLRDAINAAADNKVVTASIVNETGGARLILSGRDTGAEHEIGVSSSLLAFTQTQAAQDAVVEIDGYEHHSASNSVTGAVDGLTLKLIKAEPGTVAALTISQDATGSRSAVETFVKNYNTLVKTAAALTKFDAGTNTAAALTGDPTVRSMMQELRGIVGSQIEGGAYSALSQLGITAALDGTLTLDSVKFDAALTSNATAVQSLFTGENGYATRLAASVDAMLKDDGRLQAATDGLQARLDDSEKQTDALDRRMEDVEARYRRQFVALDTLIAQLQSTSDYLTTQLAALSDS